MPSSLPFLPSLPVPFLPSLACLTFSFSPSWLSFCFISSFLLVLFLPVPSLLPTCPPSFAPSFFLLPFLQLPSSLPSVIFLLSSPVSLLPPFPSIFSPVSSSFHFLLPSIVGISLCFFSLPPLSSSLPSHLSSTLPSTSSIDKRSRQSNHAKWLLRKKEGR